MESVLAGKEGYFVSWRQCDVMDNFDVIPKSDGCEHDRDVLCLDAHTSCLKLWSLEGVAGIEALASLMCFLSSL
jgi:hypothetical protein